jgi:hypothetical protein
MDDPEEIKSLANDSFKNLYTADPQVYPDELIDLIHSPISEDINQSLCRDFLDQEIADALFQIGPPKAPGPDGMPGRFFQRIWALMKTEVITVVKSFFQ